MKRLFLKFGAFAALAALTSVAAAGLKSTQFVVVDATARVATGSMANARAGTGSQFIGCRTFTATVSPGVEATPQADCIARNSAGVLLSCTSQLPSMVAAAQSIGMDSWINFGAYPDGTCSLIHVNNSSEWAPKQP